jgi:prepilin peptidase CpaA
MIIGSWLILCVIAIFDLRDNRIPNRWVLLLIFSAVANWFTEISWTAAATHSLLGGIALFAGGICLYAVKAMAAGDVKLLGAVGCLVGWGNIMPVTLCISLSAGIVALFVLAQHTAMQPYSVNELYQKVKYRAVHLGRDPLQSTESKLVMPFAPSVVLGMALFEFLSL